MNHRGLQGPVGHRRPSKSSDDEHDVGIQGMQGLQILQESLLCEGVQGLYFLDSSMDGPKKRHLMIMNIKIMMTILSITNEHDHDPDDDDSDDPTCTSQTYHKCSVVKTYADLHNLFHLKNDLCRSA